MKGLFLLLVLVPFISFSQTLVAKFTATPVSGCPPMVVNFTDQSTGNPTSWTWDFGNGSTSTQQNTSITYFLPGSYTVKLVIKNGNNTDSIVKAQLINVNLPPVANFGTPVTSGCSPLTVPFTDSSTSSFGTITKWQWDFGDGSSSNLRNPVHVYKGSGNFTVSLLIENNIGCVKLFSRPAYIRLQPTPTANFTQVVSQGCSPPATATFTNTSLNASTSTFTWDFGDGTTSTVRNPTHSYPNPGVYTIKLIATNPNGCSDTLVKANAITVQFAKADFTNTGACAGTPVTFNNTSLPGSVSAKWSFGDGSTSNVVNPVKTFATPGTYQVKLVNDFGSCIDSLVKTVVITAKPVPAFTATNNSGCQVPLTVNFTNTTGVQGTYLWNFGDGSTSTLENPVHTYTAGGSFAVSLTLTNGPGCAGTTVKNDFVQIRAPKIQSFRNLPVKGCLPYTINPTAVVQTSDPVISYQWSFGDGGTSTLANPSHTYTTPGSFTVKLVITTSAGCTDTLVITDIVKVGNKPTAAFSADPLSVCSNVPVQFTDTSAGNVTEWLWIFGDGSTSTLQNPRHVYSDTGKQSVTLIATSFGCTDTLRKKDYIYVIPPVAIYDTAFLCTDRMTRRFVDRSIDAKTWSWNFGDGSTSTTPSPSHTFASSGSYQVVLIVTNGACSDTLAKRVKVIAKTAVFAIDKPEICKNTPALFNVTNVDTADIVKYAWYFSGVRDSLSTVTNTVPLSFTYHATGNYQPNVQITDSVGCIDTLSLPVPVKVYGPIAAFGTTSPGICFATPLIFNDSSTTDGIHPLSNWSWNFGDSTTQSFNGPPFVHSYNATGSFAVALKVTDSFGCTDSISKPAVVTVAKSDANFSSPDTLSCPGAPVNFTGLSTGPNQVYNWSFGDGSTSTQAKPSHSYTNPGKYTVRLIIISEGGCTDTVVKPNYITIDRPRAKFSVSDTFVCQPIQIVFSDSSHYASSWEWTFDNGNTSTLQNPVNVFSSSQVYRVRLIATSPGGCQDTAYKVINVDLLSATLTYTPLQGCAPLAVSFTAHSSRRVDYIWNFGDGNSVVTRDSTVSNIYTVGGKYLPQILLRDVRGCIVPVNGADTILIEKMIPKVAADKVLLCDSGRVQFTDSSSSLGPLTYFWSFGDGATSTLRNPAHFYTKSGSYTVKLIVTSTLFGCTDSIVYPALIVVNTTVTPSLTITASQTDICAGKPVVFVARPVNGGTLPVYQWKVNGNNISQTGDSITLTNLADKDVVSCVLKSSIYCITTSAAVSNDIVMAVTSNVTPSVTITPSVNNICIRTTATFRAFAINGGAAPVFQWKINGRNAGSNIDTFATNSLQNGDIVTCVLTSSERCTTNPSASSNAVKMTVYDYPTVNAGPDQIVLQGWRGQLNPTVTAVDATYRWTPSTYLSNNTELRPVITPLSDVLYKLTVTGIGGCTASDDVAYKVLKLYIPNVFSPNGDGINDTWIINNLQFFPTARVDIFNRHGQLLFHSDGYEHPWNGTYNGAPLPVATYYYVIAIKDQGMKPIGGSVTILR